MSTLSVVTRRSSRGPLYHVVQPPVPRIPDAYLECVVYLYRSEVDAEDGVHAGGSGFLVGMMSEGLSTEMVFLYVVTNKHVVRDCTVIRMKTKIGQKTVMLTKKSDWVHHPDGDDLSACVISFDPNEFRFKYAERTSFLTKEIVDTFKIGPGDDVFMVGRFINHEGRQLNLPSVRFGNIAQMPIEPIKTESGFWQESFLIEIKSVGGYSGSPLFVQIPLFSNRSLDNWSPTSTFPFQQQREYDSLMSHGPWLLGIDWGHINDWAPVCREDGKPVNSNPKALQVKLNTGMAAVVPAWKLAQLLDDGPLADHRRHIVQLIIADQTKSPPAATSD